MFSKNQKVFKKARYAYRSCFHAPYPGYRVTLFGQSCIFGLPPRYSSTLQSLVTRYVIDHSYLHI